jgi:succinyl-CoA synthetase beta subunit
VAECIGLKPALYPGFVKTALNLYRLFVEKDCSLVEINPLAETADGRLMAVDAKLDFDQNAVAHHEDIRALRDVGEEDPLEVEASKYGLSYISMDGNIGCMVNGAVSPWRRWTSSAMWAVLPPTSWTWGGAPPQKRWRRRFGFFIG